MRHGKFTSSEIVELVKLGTRDMTEDELKEWKKENPKSQKKTIECMTEFSKGGLTYIEEKRLERKFDCPLSDVGTDAFATSWGNLCEEYVFKAVMGMEWEYCSSKFITHPTIEGWGGTPDAVTRHGVIPKSVADIKCPATRKSFLTFLDCKDMDEVCEKHPDGLKYKWQLVSNAILTDAEWCELHIFMPHQDQHDEIKGLAFGTEHEWLTRRELPWVPDHITTHILFRFQPSQADKDFLTERVKMANEKLK